VNAAFVANLSAANTEIMAKLQQSPANVEIATLGRHFSEQLPSYLER
jgi:hypothetical protein